MERDTDIYVEILNPNDWETLSAFLIKHGFKWNGGDHINSYKPPHHTCIICVDEEKKVITKLSFERYDKEYDNPLFTVEDYMCQLMTNTKE